MWCTSGSGRNAEDYPNTGEHLARLFMIARMLEMLDGHVRSEQISFVLGRNTLLTFQEGAGGRMGPDSPADRGQRLSPAAT